MTPDDIRSQRFATRLLRGLSPEEVAAFLEDVAEAYDNLQKANASLASRVQSLEDQIQALAGVAMPMSSAEATREAETQAAARLRAADEREASASGHIELLRTAALREVEALLHDAQIQAQAVVDAARERDAEMLRDTETLKAQMQREVAELVAGATASAESLIGAAKEQESAIRSEIDRLTQSRLQLVDDIRNAIETYRQWLESVDPRGRARGRDAFDVPHGGRDHTDAPDEARVA
jgi:DivIVA domain-containing protein